MSILQELARESSPYPSVDLLAPALPRPGLQVETPRFCKKVFSSGSCSEFYRGLLAAQGRHQCPFGFSVWAARIGGAPIALSGVVATPRFGSPEERLRAREAPASHVSVDAVERWLARITLLVGEGDRETDAEFSRRLEALHEIRKLNQIIKTTMERVCTQQSPDRDDPDQAPAELVRAYRASSLVSFQLDALDLLATSSSPPPFQARRWVFYRTVDKLVRIYRVLAEARSVDIRLLGRSVSEVLVDLRTIHIIPSAFIDNAIKYSVPGGAVSVTVADELLDGRQTVGFHVTSEGPVATPQEEAALFTSRGRGVAARATAEGTGVGLALAKVVANQHDAVLRAKQKPLLAHGRSTWTFSCYVPVAP